MTSLTIISLGAQIILVPLPLVSNLPFLFLSHLCVAVPFDVVLVFMSELLMSSGLSYFVSTRFFLVIFLFRVPSFFATSITIMLYVA